MSDFLLIENGDGGDFICQGGIKEDFTFYTAIYLSLFNGDCFYNAFSDFPTDLEFEQSLNATITVQNLRTVETKAQSALTWMKTLGLTDNIEVVARGNEKSKIEVDILITEPNGTLYRFSIVWENEKYFLRELN